MATSNQIIISHRGNLTGPNTATHGENHPQSIKNVLNKGFGCEVDVRWIEDKGYFLGHDKPEYAIDKDFFYNRDLYIHCKDVLTMSKLVNMDYFCFFHQNDDIALVANSGLLWSYPRKDV